MESQNPATATATEAEEEEEEAERGEETLASSSSSSLRFPAGRVKKIVKLDRDINKISSEALHLISLSAHLFLSSLAAASAEAAKSKKRKIINLQHLRSAVQIHPPTSDFLLDCLPNPSPSTKRTRSDSHAQAAQKKPPLPPGARRIDNFFQKATAGWAE